MGDQVTRVTRLVSVDVFRGMTIVAMILVNNPGNFRTTYWPLKHAEWHGWTPTDLVFPFFLFIVGVAIVLALKGRLEAGTPRTPLVAKVVKRSLILFGLGLFLTGFPFGLFGPRGFGEFLEGDHLRQPVRIVAVALCGVAWIRGYLDRRMVPAPFLDVPAQAVHKGLARRFHQPPGAAGAWTGFSYAFDGLAK